MSTIQYLSSSESGDRASAIYTDAMARMYGLVANIFLILLNLLGFASDD